MPVEASQNVISRDALLKHWQGHRRLTRRVIDAFPDDQLFEFTIGGMRTFGAMAMELLSMATPMARGLAKNEWSTSWDRDPIPRAELLERWDEATTDIDALWPDITAEKLHGRTTAFGQYEGIGHDLLLYVIDNEIHHRAQGFVYLRALGVEPPPFYDR